MTIIKSITGATVVMFVIAAVLGMFSSPNIAQTDLANPNRSAAEMRATDQATEHKRQIDTVDEKYYEQERALEFDNQKRTAESTLQHQQQLQQQEIEYKQQEYDQQLAKQQQEREYKRRQYEQQLADQQQESEYKRRQYEQQLADQRANAESQRTALDTFAKLVGIGVFAVTTLTGIGATWILFRRGLQMTRVPAVKQVDIWSDQEVRHVMLEAARAKERREREEGLRHIPAEATVQGNGHHEVMDLDSMPVASIDQYDSSVNLS